MAYDALFDRYGVQRVEDMDEWVTAMIMFAQPHPVADGGIVTLHDSGGERQLIIDLADTRTVDSAGLGALMLIQRHAAERRQIVALRSVSDELRFLLMLTKLDELFELVTA